MKKRIIFIALIILILIGPYLKVELLTYLYGEQFEELYGASGWIDDIKYLKVMKYDDRDAEIYYVSKNQMGESDGGFLYILKKESGIWVLDSWKCIWSQHGNADEFMWPYYMH